MAELVDALDLKSNGGFFTVPVRVRLSAQDYGVWRSGLARLVWDEEVVSSSLTTPTSGCS